MPHTSLLAPTDFQTCIRPCRGLFTQTDSTILQWGKSYIKSYFDVKVEQALKKYL